MNINTRQRYLPIILNLSLLNHFVCLVSLCPAGEPHLETRATSGCHATRTTSAASLCTPATPSCRPGDSLLFIFYVHLFFYRLISWECFTTKATNGNSRNTKTEHRHFLVFCMKLLSLGGFKISRATLFDKSVVYMSNYVYMCVFESTIKQEMNSLQRLSHSDAHQVLIDISIY